MAHRAEYKKLVEKIGKFQSEFSLSDGYFGQQAAGNGRFLERLHNGQRFWPETIQRVEDYIKTETKKRRLPRCEGKTQRAAQ